MAGLSRHVSQRASCALALLMDPKHSKKRAASVKSHSFNYDVGEEHNLNIAYLDDDDDQVLLSLRKLTEDIVHLKEYLANMDQTVARQLVDDLLFNHSDFIDVEEGVSLMEDIELLNPDPDPLNDDMEDEDTIGSYDEMEMMLFYSVPALTLTMIWTIHFEMF
jgi:hypothetical protein